MSRPTRPPGPPHPDEPYSDDPYGEEPYPADRQPPPPAAQPRFTPRTGPRQQPYPGPPPPPPGARATQPQAPSRDTPVQPTFTPSGPGAPGAPSGRGGRHGGRPRPSFTPREGYAPTDGKRRDAAPPPTAFFSPAPAGYQPVPVPEEYGYAPTAAPRFTPVDRREQFDDGDNRTRILERPVGEAPPTGPQRTADDTSPNLARSSKAMAFGTIASRGTGFLRTFVLLYVLGTAGLSGAYNNSNTLPNTVYYLMLGGIFTAVVVPLLVRAAKEDPDRGDAYAERIFTLGVVSLLIVTVVAT